NIRVRDLDLGRTQQVTLHLRIIEMRMVKPDSHRSKKSIEIDEAAIIYPVVQIWAAALVEIHDDLETVQQNVLLNRVEDFRRLDCLFRFALWRALSVRWALREGGCITLPRS